MSRRTIVIMLAVVCFAWSLPAQEPPRKKDFKVAYIVGPGEFNSDTVMVSVGPDSLLFSGKAGKKKQTYSIPFNSITTMIHSPTRFNRAGGVAGALPNLPPPRMEGGGGSIGAAVNALMLMSWGAYHVGRTAAIGVGATQHGQRHFIEIDWRSQGVEYNLLVEASKSDYAALIKQIENGSGKKVYDLDARWRQVEQELSKEKEHAAAIMLDRRTKLDELSLPPGRYSAILLPRDNDLGEVYLFEGKSILNTAMRGVLVVRVEKAADTNSEAPTVEYTKELPPEIASIRLADTLLRVVSSR